MRVCYIFALFAAVIGTAWGQMAGGCACGQAAPPTPVYLLGQAPCPQTPACQPQQQIICPPVQQCQPCLPPTTTPQCIPQTTTCPPPQQCVCPTPPPCQTPPPIFCPTQPPPPSCPPPVICPPMPTCAPPIQCPPQIICPEPVPCPITTIPTCPPPPPCPITTIPTCPPPPPTTCAPPTPPPVCICPTTPQICQQPVSQPCSAPVQNFGNCCYQCGSSCRRAKMARRAKKDADFAFNATSGNVTSLCNNNELRELMKNNMTENAQESKIAVQKVAELKFKSIFAVVCGTGDFSIVSDSDMYCQHEVGNVTCFAFRQ